MRSINVLTKIVLSVSALGALSIAVPATSQSLETQGVTPSDPLSELAQMNDPRDQFSLYSSHEIELVRFKSSHLLSICDARADPTSKYVTKHAYPLLVTFDGQTATIEPGNCFAFEAQSVKIKPGTTLPQNVMLNGTVRVIH